MKKGMFKRLLQVLLCWVVILAIIEYGIAKILFYMFNVVKFIVTGDWLDDDDFSLYYYKKWPINKIIWWLYP